MPCAKSKGCLFYLGVGSKPFYGSSCRSRRESFAMGGFGRHQNTYIVTLLYYYYIIIIIIIIRHSLYSNVIIVLVLKYLNILFLFYYRTVYVNNCYRNVVKVSKSVARASWAKMQKPKNWIITTWSSSRNVWRLKNNQSIFGVAMVSSKSLAETSHSIQLRSDYSAEGISRISSETK